MSTDNSFYIVGMGLSAGGFSALTKLLSLLTVPTKASFVVVVHLPAGSNSQLPSLLTSTTHLQASWIKEGEKPAKDCIHLLPPGYLLTLQASKFGLQPRDSNQKINRTIDTFFISLAKDAKQRAIGVILAGSGSDGLVGVQSIEAHGGLVLVQHPSTAEFVSMPANVVNKDHPDFVTSPEGIAQALTCHLQIRPFFS